MKWTFAIVLILLSGEILWGQSRGILPLLSPDQVVQINDNSLFTRRQELADSTAVIRNLLGGQQNIIAALISDTTDANGDFTLANPTGNANATVFITPIVQDFFGFPSPLHYEVLSVTTTNIICRVYSPQFQQFAINQPFSAYILIIE